MRCFLLPCFDMVCCGASGHRSPSLRTSRRWSTRQGSKTDGQHFRQGQQIEDAVECEHQRRRHHHERAEDDLGGEFAPAAGLGRPDRSHFPLTGEFPRRAAVQGFPRRQRLAGLEGSRSRAVGDLRENLSQRRVLGSSFAQDALTRANLEFQQEKDKVEAESFLQELELSHMIATEEFEARRGEFQTTIYELNLQADIATKLATAATSQLGANARLKAELDAKNAAGTGQFLGKLLGFALGTGGASLIPASVGMF